MRTTFHKVNMTSRAYENACKPPFIASIVAATLGAKASRSFVRKPKLVSMEKPNRSKIACINMAYPWIAARISGEKKIMTAPAMHKRSGQKAQIKVK